MVVLFLAGLAATAYMYLHVPTGFVPQEDQNYFIVVVQAPPGASLSYTTQHLAGGGKGPARRPGRLRHLRGARLLALRRQLVELRTGLRSAEADRRAQRARACGQRHCGARVAQAVRHSRSDRGGLRAAGDSRHRQLWRIPVPACRTWAATRCRTWITWRTRSSPPAASART